MLDDIAKLAIKITILEAIKDKINNDMTQVEVIETYSCNIGKGLNYDIDSKVVLYEVNNEIKELKKILKKKNDIYFSNKKY